MTKRPASLVFDRMALTAALNGGDELTRALADLMCRFDTGDVVATAMDLHDRLWRPEKPTPKKGGAPPKWNDGKKLYAWLAVESQWRADRQTHYPNCTIEESISRKFARLPRRGNRVWRVLNDTGAQLVAEHPGGVGALGPNVRFMRGPEGGQHLELSTVETARKYHRQGAVVLAKMRSDVGSRWRDLADTAALAIISAAGTKPKQK